MHCLCICICLITIVIGRWEQLPLECNRDRRESTKWRNLRVIYLCFYSIFSCDACKQILCFQHSLCLSLQCTVTHEPPHCFRKLCSLHINCFAALHCIDQSKQLARDRNQLFTEQLAEWEQNVDRLLRVLCFANKNDYCCCTEWRWRTKEGHSIADSQFLKSLWCWRTGHLCSYHHGTVFPFAFLLVIP